MRGWYHAAVLDTLREQARRALGLAPGASAARQLIKRGLERALPRRLLVTDMPRGDGRVYLTFDDGPHPEHTPALLDALAAAGARATFFVIGAHAAVHPGLVRRMVDEGHTVGGHSWHHDDPARTSPRVLADEMRRAADTIAQATGQPSRLCRPPYGAVSAEKLARLWAARFQVVLWNVDPRDYQAGSGAALAAAFAAAPPAAGDVVLLHDSHPHAAAALPAALAAWRASGLTAAALPRG